MIDPWPDDDEMCEECACGHTLGQHEYGSDRARCDVCSCDGMHPIHTTFVTREPCWYRCPDRPATNAARRAASTT